MADTTPHRPVYRNIHVTQIVSYRLPPAGMRPQRRPVELHRRLEHRGQAGPARRGLLAGGLHERVEFTTQLDPAPLTLAAPRAPSKWPTEPYWLVTEPPARTSS